jgi:hypothetical protein
MPSSRASKSSTPSARVYCDGALGSDQARTSGLCRTDQQTAHRLFVGDRDDLTILRHRAERVGCDIADQIRTPLRHQMIGDAEQLEHTGIVEDGLPVLRIESL